MNYARSTDTPPVICHTCGATFTDPNPSAADAFLAAHAVHARPACDHFTTNGRPWCSTCGRRKHYHPDPVQAPPSEGSPAPLAGGSCTVAGPPPTVAGPGTSPPGPA